MVIFLCFIVCFFVLCYIKGFGKEKKEGGILGCLIELVLFFLDIVFMEFLEKNGKLKRLIGVLLFEEEFMVQMMMLKYINVNVVMEGFFLFQEVYY